VEEGAVRCGVARAREQAGRGIRGGVLGRKETWRRVRRNGPAEDGRIGRLPSLLLPSCVRVTTAMACGAVRCGGLGFESPRRRTVRRVGPDGLDSWPGDSILMVCTSCSLVLSEANLVYY
jgi:hypothetical protein